MGQETPPIDDFIRTPLTKTIDIDNIITIHYFEFVKDYVFTGERHNFWEFLYVDRGEVQVTVDHTTHMLQQGTIIFHKPNEYHSFHALNGKAPNLIVMTFDCHSQAMCHLEDQVMQLKDEERNLLAKIIEEAKHVFAFPFDYPLHRRMDGLLGSEQLIQSYLEIFLLQLIRSKNEVPPAKSLSSAVREKNHEDIVSKVIAYMEDHIGHHLTLEELSHTFLISKTQLKDVFKHQTESTVMEYFLKLKLHKAKLMIREGNSNMTEIASQLGFSSVHYFSKAFKKKMNMTPTEYARSVKSRLVN
ncbi:AraC family transcriptional regulator [Paenibacillus selenitireducens]|uniref:AraC family transcriptional regulator n=1 Tax=Paenibacillus selenitireducens TaxID=1324314 RepID=UPI001E4F9F90|nr:AraC family transcriptional regulator [Paenibacillus selenitireducens]